MLKEFKEFALKGNMIDLAVGVIIGGACHFSCRKHHYAYFKFSYR